MRNIPPFSQTFAEGIRCGDRVRPRVQRDGRVQEAADWPQCAPGLNAHIPTFSGLALYMRMTCACVLLDVTCSICCYL